MKYKKYKFKCLLLILILITCFQLYFDQNVLGFLNNPDIYVDVNGNANFSNIQDAIDNAITGDIIYVKNGIYYENIVIDKKITLTGENSTKTIIDGRLAGNTIKINSNDVKIQNFTIQNSGIYFPNSGINITSKNNIIRSNIIKNNLYGITMYFSSNNSIIGNIINENTNCGIYLTNSINNIFLNNSIMNHDFNGIGIYDKSNYNIIKNNIFKNNGYCGINIKLSSMNEIILNNLSNNYIGIHIPSDENIIYDNEFFQNNNDIDKPILTPGFEFLLIIFSIIFLIFFKRKNNKLN